MWVEPMCTKEPRGELIMMQEKPYFCPNCRSNRVKFNIITTMAQRCMKDAVTGEIMSIDEPQMIEESEATVQCLVCRFTGNEMRFIRQAKREPRIPYA